MLVQDIIGSGWSYWKSLLKSGVHSYAMHYSLLHFGYSINTMVNGLDIWLQLFRLKNKIALSSIENDDSFHFSYSTSTYIVLNSLRFHALLIFRIFLNKTHY